MRHFVGLLFLVGLIGCVKNDGFGQAEAKSAGDSLGTGIEDSAASFGPVNGGATADSACVTLVGDTSDADGDSIPANASLTFNCTAMAFGATGTLTGSETVIDTMPAAVAWAFTATGDFQASLTAGGASITRDWNGEFRATQGSPLGPFSLARTLDVETVFTGANGRSTTVTEDNDWTITFTPQVTWTPGGIIVTGSIAASGSWNFLVNSAANEAELETTTPLTLTPSCATRITAGKITGTFTGQRASTIAVTWTGCGIRTVTFTEN